MEASRLAALDQRFKLTESMNSEIAHVWYRLAIANRYTAAYPAMERYMIRIGRRKFIVPLYRDLAAYPAMERYMIKIGRRKLILPLYRDLSATPEGKVLATKIYEKARDGYHPMAKDGVEGVLRKAAS